jgi:three-Cys-motif partner protein
LATQSFGSSWTEQKLGALEKYLAAYRTIFTGNEKAKYFKTIYVDAFAGSGTRLDPASTKELDGQDSLFEEFEEEEDSGFRKGSVRIALELEQPFDQYYFIEKNKEYEEQLRTMIATEYSALASRCVIHRGDATEALMQFITTFNQKKERAVVFLDPYGMSVEWNVLRLIGETKAIDLWLLFPHGIGVNRLLTTGELPSKRWQDKLTATFGTNEWIREFYTEKVPEQSDLFEEQKPAMQKVATFDSINRFMIKRLRTVFAGGVVEKPLLLSNSRGTPLYSLCFAVTNPNPSASRAALNIADWVSTN